MLVWTTHYAQRHRLLGLALLVLHPVFLLAPDEGLRTALLLLHFGLILLWQPFFDRSTRFSHTMAAVAIAAGVAVIAFGGWVAPALWVILLLGLIGGESPSTRRDTVAQWLAIMHLFGGLLAGLAPGLFDVPGGGHEALSNLLFGATALPLAMLALQAGRPVERPMRFDPLRSTGITLIALLLVGGAVLWSFQSGVIYPLALVQALPTAGLLLLVLNWIWQRASTHSLMQLIWNRYLLNLGTPFEQYLMRLTGPAAQQMNPGEYLDHVVAALAELDWVEGVEAQAPDGERRVGDCSSHPTRLSGDQLALTVFTRRDPTPALRLHIQLLLRLAHQLWDSRRREAEMRSQARVRAIYETGARLTHDTKNLLQSLQSLTAAVSDTPPARAAEALELVKRQLPPINQRLHATLEKLREPTETDEGGEPIALDEWWEEVVERFASEPVRFECADDSIPDGFVPKEVFDNVLENLLENARYKQSMDRDVAIRVSLATTAAGAHVEVADSGEAMPAEKARELFSGAVESAQGLGVGLYQAASLAARYGYALELMRNAPGDVRFSLTGPLHGRTDA